MSASVLSLAVRFYFRTVHPSYFPIVKSCLEFFPRLIIFLDKENTKGFSISFPNFPFLSLEDERLMMENC